MASSAGSSGADRRRGERILMRVPVRLHGINKEGKRVSEKGETVVISSNGALLKVESDFKPGSEIDLDNLSNDRSAKFRVVWVSDRPTEGRYEVGLDSGPKAADIWGVEFPAAEAERP